MKSKESKNSKKGEIKPGDVVGYEVIGRPDQIVITGAVEKKTGNAVVLTVKEVIHNDKGCLDISEGNIKSDAFVSIPAMKLYLELTDEAQGNPHAMMRKLGKKADKVIQELIDNGLAFYGKDQSGRKTVEVDVFDVPQ